MFTAALPLAACGYVLSAHPKESHWTRELIFQIHIRPWMTNSEAQQPWSSGKNRQLVQSCTWCWWYVIVVKLFLMFVHTPESTKADFVHAVCSSIAITCQQACFESNRLTVSLQPGAAWTFFDLPQTPNQPTNINKSNTPPLKDHGEEPLPWWGAWCPASWCYWC